MFCLCQPPLTLPRNKALPVQVSMSSFPFFHLLCPAQLPPSMPGGSTGTGHAVWLLTSLLLCWFSFHRSKAESGLLWMKPIPVRKPILHFSHPLRFGEHSWNSAESWQVLEDQWAAASWSTSHIHCKLGAARHQHSERGSHKITRENTPNEALLEWF